MKYTCQHCGATALLPDDLCRPTPDKSSAKFCGYPARDVCGEKIGAMTFTCTACGSVSADPDHLCSPERRDS